MTDETMTVEQAGRELTMTRIFDAPRELVFETFSSCEHLERWWGPREWPLDYCEMDFREGGVWHFCMRGPNGGESWGKAVFQEIVEPERIVYRDYFSNEDGDINDQMPATLSTFEFEEIGDKTKVVSRSEYEAAEDLEELVDLGMIEGFTESWDRLDEHLADGREIVITRHFDAPREAVFDAWTDAEAIGNWWGPDGFSTTTERMEFRPGGEWIFTMHGPDGTDYSNEVVYEEIEAPERLVYRHGSGDPGEDQAFEVTVTFAECDGRTSLILRHTYDSPQGRERSVEIGAIDGGRQTLSRLAEHLA